MCTQEDNSFFGRKVAVSSGTGVIVGEEGTILTNAHVVADILGKDDNSVVIIHDINSV